MSTLSLGRTGSPEGALAHLPRPAPRVVAALFCGYLAVGLPLPVLPLFVHDGLGFSDFTVGLVIGIQFLATVLTRAYAGRLTDQQGGKRSALQGAAGCALAGLLYLVAAIPGLPPAISLAIVVTGRLAAGIGESQFVTGCVSWSIASVGPQRAGMSMSWTGIAMFAALSIGAPIGMALYRSAGLQAVMLACIAAPLAAAAMAHRATAYASSAGQRLSFHHVVGRIWRQGLGLTLQGVGLSALTAFASLHFEAIGQGLMWSAPSEGIALAGAFVTGLGCALVYPALGVEALKQVPPASRGSAMGAFAAFLDIAYGLAGPAAGLIAGQFGYAAVYVLGCACALLGACLVLRRDRGAT
jgi:MFS family permease